MKTTRINCGPWSIDNADVELAEKLFGPGGTQADRRWFYRLLDTEQDWRRKGRYAKLNVVLYFRHSVDAVFFTLKKSG
jgi:hypothetical protein